MTTILLRPSLHIVLNLYSPRSDLRQLFILDSANKEHTMFPSSVILGKVCIQRPLYALWVEVLRRH